MKLIFMKAIFEKEIATNSPHKEQITHDEQNPVLCILGTCVDFFLTYTITHYMAHQGCLRTFLTNRNFILLI